MCLACLCLLMKNSKQRVDKDQSHRWQQVDLRLTTNDVDQQSMLFIERRKVMRHERTNKLGRVYYSERRNQPILRITRIGFHAVEIAERGETTLVRSSDQRMQNPVRVRFSQRSRISEVSLTRLFSFVNCIERLQLVLFDQRRCLASHFPEH